MKKLVVALFVATVAVATQAASVKWTIASITDSPSNTAKAGMVAYFMDASTYSAFSALTSDKVAEYVTANYTYTGATTANARTGAISLGPTSGNYSAGDEISGYVVLFDTSDASTAGYYVGTGVVTKTVGASGGNVTLDFGTVASAGGWQTTAVPEPTSGLLMLLGMAGLALRRRRA